MKKRKKLTDYISVFSIAVFALAAAAGALQAVFTANPQFADWFNMNVSAYIRQAAAAATGWFPFSLAEFIVFSAPVLCVLIIVICFRMSDRGVKTVKIILGLLSMAALMLIGFVLTVSPGYRGTSLDKKLELDRREVSASELYETMNIVVDRINGLEDSITYTDTAGSVRPYSHEECVKLCAQSYEKLRGEYGFIGGSGSTVKRLVISEFMTYTHISGVYTYFTGESNLNTNYPYFINVYTTAHEMAHQRGISREDEANFMAYLACIKSDDPYMQYAGYLNMFEYLADALYDASPTLYGKAAGRLCEGAWHELECYSRFFDKYRESTAATVSDAVNDTYLKAQGTAGTASYGMVVDLAVAYYRQNGTK